MRSVSQSGNRKGWTFDAFEDHMEAIFRERDKALRAALKAMDKRLAGMNEFRSTISDQSRTLMPRTEADIRLAAQGADISALKASRDTGAGRTQGMSVGAKVAIAAVSLFVVLLGLFVTGVTIAGALYAILKH